MMHKYYTLRRPPMPGSIPSGAVETGELSERIRINGLGTAWGYACYDHELTVGEMADYELAYWEAVEASETAPAPAPVEVSEIAPDHITAAGVVMPAEYRTSSTGRSITAFVAMDGERFRVVFSGVCGELFTACQRATKGETVTVDGDDLMTVLGTAAQVKEKAPREVNPDKECHGEVPEKWFVGQALEGKRTGGEGATSGALSTRENAEGGHKSPWRIDYDNNEMLVLTQKQFDENQYTGRSIRDESVRTLMIPSIHGCCLIFEGKHFRIEG